MCFFQAEDGIRDLTVTGVQTCALPILLTPVARLPMTSATSASPSKMVAGTSGSTMVSPSPMIALGDLRKALMGAGSFRVPSSRSEEHTSELQSQANLVCRLLLETKKIA